MSVYDVHTSGPLFSAGLADEVLRTFEREIVHDVTAQASADVHTNLHDSIRHPTPYYETQVRMQTLSEAEGSVNDRGIIYGPWLEGTGSRNRTTRFKGYSSFRRAKQSTEAKVIRLVGPALARCVQRLGG